MTMLFRLVEWHALAKLHMHTDMTLTYLDSATETLGCQLRHFCNFTCPAFSTVELPKEAAACGRAKKCNAANTASNTTNKRSGTAPIPLDARLDPALGARPTRRRRTFQLNMVKVHFLGDYSRTIRLLGITDSYSTQTVRDYRPVKFIQ